MEEESDAESKSYSRRDSRRRSEDSDKKQYSEYSSKSSDIDKAKRYSEYSSKSSDIDKAKRYSEYSSRFSDTDKRKRSSEYSSKFSDTDKTKRYSEYSSKYNDTDKTKRYSEYSSKISDTEERDGRDRSVVEGSNADDSETRSSITRISEEHGELRDGYYLLTRSQMTLILPFAKRWIEALEYTRRKIFEDIDPHIIYKLVYPDCLEVFVGDDSVGEFTLIMGRIRRKEGACIMIHANNHAIIDGIKCGSDITTIVTMNLETVQHVYHDYVELPHKVVDNKLVIVRDDENYFIKKISFDGERADKKTEKIPRKQLIGYISEGACFLLHRYFLKTQRRTPICLNSLDMNLQKCSVTFAPLEEAAQLVHGTLLYTLGILQTTMNADGVTDTWITYYNRVDFHMTRRQQFDSPTEMLLVRLPVGLGRPAPDFMSDWEGNPQLWSHFVERKASIMTDYMEYLHKHEEIKALLSDFLLFLLHRKPTDICDAATYFFNDFLKDY